MQTSHQTDQFDVRDVARGVLKNSWLIGAVVLAAVLVALVRSSLQERLFAATAVVRVVNPAGTSVLPDQNKVDPAREVELQRLYAGSGSIAAAFDARVGPDAPVHSVNISSVLTADAIQIQVVSKSRSFAQRAAQAYAEVYVDARRRDVADTLKSQSDKLRQDGAAMKDQIAAIDRRLAEIAPKVVYDSRGAPVALPESEEAQSLRADRAALSARYDDSQKQASQLDVESSVRQAGVTIISAPKRPTSPVQPTPVRDAVIAAALGLFVGLALALARMHADDRIRTGDDVEGIVAEGLPVVSVPRNPAYRATKGARPLLPTVDRSSSEVEAYRALRASLLFGRSGEGHPRRVLVSSANKAEGKTTTAANLALTMAQSGRRVVLVDCDLRRPRVHESFGLANKVGFVSVVADGRPLADALKTVDVGGSQPLYVVPAGPVPTNPAELLVSKRAGALMDELADTYDFVICDSSPLLAVADALPLATLTDGVILVARSGRTRTRQLEDVVAQLDRVAAPPLAVVVGQTRGGTHYADHYGDRYGDGYGDRSSRTRASRSVSDTPTGAKPTRSAKSAKSTKQGRQGSRPPARAARR